MLRIGVDTGGTFTDVVCLDDQGRLRTAKLPTTRMDPAQGIVQAIAQLGCEPAEPFHCTHGTTVATNALLERQGGRVGLITTKGFSDLLTLGRGQRPQLYQLEPHRPRPLVDEELCFEVNERVSASGEILVPLCPAEVGQLGQTLLQQGVEEVAVCLLFCHIFPQHEQAVGEILGSMGLRVFLSHRLCPEEREFERCSTTAVSAYVSSCLVGYLSRIESALSARGCKQLHVVHSGGAKITVSEARANPANCILSGPAAGVRGAFSVARTAGLKRFLCLDMGGTSTDVAICQGAMPYVSEALLENFPVRQLSVDIHTVGAGGGSIIRLDQAGALVVGPQSVGSNPGPAAYGLGNLPCVTDANVVLGRLPTTLAGGRVEIYVDKARQALQPIADRLGYTLEGAAAAALAVVRSSMERALRRVSVERGHDPRDFTLLAYGGAGPLHAAELAELLGCKKVFVPRYPGLLCALGAALSPWQRQFSQSLHLPAAELSQSQLDSLTEKLEQQAATAWSSQRKRRPKCDRFLELRYRGQGQPLVLPLQGTVTSTIQAFEALHRKLFGYIRSDQTIEAVALRLRATGPIPSWPLPPPERQEPDPGQPTRIHVGGSSQPQAATLYERRKIAANQALASPCIIHQEDCTTFVPPGWEGYCDPHGNICLQRTFLSVPPGRGTEAGVENMPEQKYPG